MSIFGDSASLLYIRNALNVVLANQNTIMANQRTALANQEKIMALLDPITAELTTFNTDLAALVAAVSAIPANTVTPAEVQTIVDGLTAADAQIKALTASLVPATPAP